MATFRFRGDASDWWETWLSGQPLGALSIAMVEFEEAFLEQLTNKSLRDRSKVLICLLMSIIPTSFAWLVMHLIWYRMRGIVLGDLFLGFVNYYMM